MRSVRLPPFSVLSRVWVRDVVRWGPGRSPGEPRKGRGAPWGLWGRPSGQPAAAMPVGRGVRARVPMMAVSR